MIRPAVVLSNIGRLILIIGIAMLTCIPWSLLGQEDAALGIVQAAGLTIISGLFLIFYFSRKIHMNFKEGLALVSLGWLVVSFFGSLPYLFTGYLPSFADALFETISGFTTTGSSVVSDVEAWPRGLLFWRSLTQWLGGMGIIALFVAMIAGMGARANQMFKAEVPGPISDKISPRIRENAKRLWKAYVIISLICAILLFLQGMDLFDSLCHTFTTMATGGFSSKNASIGHYASPLIQWTIILFMFIAGTSFSLHIIACNKHNPMVYLRNAEFRLYGGIMIVATFLVTISLTCSGAIANWEERIRTACFQVVSIMTTTGFATADYSIWPSLAGGVIFLMMFVGGCAGSTGGSIKPGRYLIILHRSVIELKKMIHPKAVLPLRFSGKVLNESLIINVLQFFFLYIMLLALGTLIMSALGIDILSSLTASATCLGNIGPGFGLVGPARNFASIPDVGKYTLSILMLVGRLEIYPILVLFLPEYWKE